MSCLCSGSRKIRGRHHAMKMKTGTDCGASAGPAGRRRILKSKQNDVFTPAEAGHRLSRERYKKIEPLLRTKLVNAQHRLKTAPFSVLIIVGGVDGAGKGETVNLLHEWLDPRFLAASAFGEPTDEEVRRPGHWRFWRRLPPRGRIGIFFGSWYTWPIESRVFREIGRSRFEESLDRIRKTERLLAEDGTLIIKLWFHLSRPAQRKRLKELEKDPLTSWRVTKEDWRRFRKYGRFRRISAAAIEATDVPNAPWVIVDGEDARWRNVFVARHILKRLTERLAAAGRAEPGPAVPMKPPGRRPATMLDSLDLSLRLAPAEYRKQLSSFQERLGCLARKAKQKGIASVLVFEGWDAAGKGGTIRRLTPALDARDYRIVPVGPPNDEERSRHYLWRFWREIPADGGITIFDRSWYGRVLVERVEGFAAPEEWKRAYDEINFFEEQLVRHGIILLKFWLHIDQDEQMRRFRERERVPYKRFKISEEDYRNRSRYPQYLAAVDDMLRRTSTEIAPWTLVEANDKNWARIKAIKTWCEKLELALE